MDEKAVEYIKIALDDNADIGREVLKFLSSRLTIQQHLQYTSEAEYVVHLREQMDKRLAEYRNK